MTKKINLTITGDTPSKKNSKIFFMNKGKPMWLPGKVYKKWHTAALTQLKIRPHIGGDISAVELVMYPQTKRRSDLTNKAESIMDLLVDTGIIEDDNWWIIPKVTLMFGNVDPKNPRCEISIYHD